MTLLWCPGRSRTRAAEPLPWWLWALAALLLPLISAGELQAYVPDVGAGPSGPGLDALQAAEDAAGPLVRLRGLVGVVLLALGAWALSVNRRRIPWRIVLWGLGLQFLFALLILRTTVGAGIFDAANDVILATVGFTVEGARFVFGDLVWNNVPVGVGEPGNGPFVDEGRQVARTGAFFAFNVLPTIIFFASLMTVFYHLGVMQKVVGGIAWVMQRTMKTSGAETLSAAGNIFVGQTEAPLLVKPFVDRMTRSELMAVMTGGFATVAGGVMAAYAGMLVGFFPDIAGHLMAASVMSAPAALVVAKLMVPEEEVSETAGTLKTSLERTDVNVIEAAARGAGEGLHLALNVGAMLLAFLALIALINAVLGWAGGLVGVSELSLEGILGWVLSPVGVGDGCRLGGRGGGGLADGAQDRGHRIRGLPGACRHDGRIVGVRAVGHDRHVCAVGLRQLFVDRDPDRRHRGDRAAPPAGSVPTGAQGHDRRFDRGLHDRGDRGGADLSLARGPRGAAPRGRVNG